METDRRRGRPVVMVVGGGFAGLAAARQLRRSDVDVLLVDRQNHHCFQPLLYQVATAALSPADIASPIRQVLRRQQNTSVLLADVQGVDLERRRLLFEGGESEPYDWLVLAAGVTHSYFGNDSWAAAAPGLKTIDEALEIRRRMLMAFEEAEIEADDDSRRAKLTFVVVGGGPTGVELAGAIKEIAAESIPRDFRFVDTRTTRVILVEAADRLLGAMPASLSERAREDLERMGVEVRLASRVTDVYDGGVVIGDERVAAENVLWAAGVQAVPLTRSLEVPLDRSGRVAVEPDLSIPGHPRVFVVGDLASVEDPKTGQLVPGVAQAAIQMGTYAGRLIRDGVAGRGADANRPPFRYRDKGSMATIGRGHAVAAIGRLKIKGFVAWLIWGVVHVVPLIGFRSRLSVMLSWIWSYLFFRKGARLITGDVKVQVAHVREELGRRELAGEERSSPPAVEAGDEERPGSG